MHRHAHLLQRERARIDLGDDVSRAVAVSVLLVETGRKNDVSSHGISLRDLGKLNSQLKVGLAKQPV